MKGVNFMYETIQQKSGIVVATAIVLGMIILAAVGFIQSEKLIKNQAIDGCYTAATIQFKGENNATITTPETYWFNQCMEKKGY